VTFTACRMMHHVTDAWQPAYHASKGCQQCCTPLQWWWRLSGLHGETQLLASCRDVGKLLWHISLSIPLLPLAGMCSSVQMLHQSWSMTAVPRMLEACLA
jgi:hypothetical protein